MFFFVRKDFTELRMEKTGRHFFTAKNKAFTDNVPFYDFYIIPLSFHEKLLYLNILTYLIDKLNNIIMAVRNKTELLDARKKYLDGEFDNVTTAAYGGGEDYPLNVAAAFFKREEVLKLVNNLKADYVNVFLIKKIEADGTAVISMAMAGANPDSKSAQYIDMDTLEFANLDHPSDQNQEQGIVAEKECPPRCDFMTPIGLVHLPTNNS